jgi:Protein of unknown function (DUF2855)
VSISAAVAQVRQLLEVGGRVRAARFGGMTAAWALAVAREDISRTSVLEVAVPEVEEGGALLRVDRVGVTANNVTYALLGDSFRYWDFFPTEPGLGLVPLWGFADVVVSRASGVEVGGRVYGYLPPASHLLVRPGRADARGFRDTSPHRQGLPSPYNVYALTTGDPTYEAHREDLMILYRPLFFTSFMLADQLEDNGYFGAAVLAFSSASSKTAYGAAFLLQGKGPEVVGLTSPGNVAFTESLGCYDRVLPYDAIGELSANRPAAYLDVSGSADVRARLREQLGDRLVHEAVVGATSQEQAGAEALTGPRTTVFFAPDQMRKRTDDWGREGLDQRFAEAWQRFAPAVEDWVDVVEQHGPQGLRAVWLEVLAGRSDPRTGHVVTL